MFFSCSTGSSTSAKDNADWALRSVIARGDAIYFLFDRIQKCINASTAYNNAYKESILDKTSNYTLHFDSRECDITGQRQIVPLELLKLRPLLREQQLIFI